MSVANFYGFYLQKGWIIITIIITIIIIFLNNNNNNINNINRETDYNWLQPIHVVLFLHGTRMIQAVLYWN